MRYKAIQTNAAAIVAVTLITVLGLILRMYKLESVPLPIHIDEGIIGNDVLSLLEQNFNNIFSFGYFYYPNLGFLMPALMMKILGTTYYTLRLYSVLIGTGIIVATYFLARTWFGKKVGLAAAFFIAISHYAIAMSRIGIHVIETPFYEVLAFLCVVLGLEKRKMWLVALSAAITAFGIYHYFSFRIVPLLTVLLIGLWFVGKRKLFTKEALLIFAIWMGVFVAGILPFLYESCKSDQMVSRESEVFLPMNPDLFKRIYHTDNMLTIIGEQTKKSFKLYVTGGDASNQYNEPSPRLDTVSQLFFFAGIIYFVFKIGFFPYNFILLWFVSTVFLGNVLTDTPPISPRVTGIIPALALLTAVPFTRLTSQLYKYTHFVTFSIIGILALTSLYINWHIYFISAPRYVYFPWVEPKSSIALYLNKLGPDYNYYIVNNPDVYAEHTIIRFLTYGKQLPIRNIRSEEICSLPSSHNAIIILPYNTEKVEEIESTILSCYQQATPTTIHGHAQRYDNTQLLFTAYRLSD